jgi:glutathione S-transferase
VTVVLWHIEVSHYNEKARWALDYKSIAHELRVPMPGLHGAKARVLTHGKHGRLPVMELEGRRIGDSTAIIAALEAYQPEPSLYPADSAQKAHALELEDFFDEQLAPQMRRLVWHHVLQDTDAIADSLFGDRAPGRARSCASPRRRYGRSCGVTTGSRQSPRRSRTARCSPPWTASRLSCSPRAISSAIASRWLI